MPLESLLVSRDPDVIRILQPALAKLTIDVEVCPGAHSGTEIIFTEKFDAVIVDCDDLKGGVEVLQDLRRSPSNRSSIAFAILNGATTTHQAFELGATFVMQKPLSALGAMRCFCAGLGLMVRERRRYFRCPAELAVVVTLESNQEIRVTTTNVSEGGMAIRGGEALAQGGVGKVSLVLPDVKGTIEAKAEFVWVDGSGRAGIRFLEMNKNSKQILDHWLDEEILRIDPLPDVKRFAH